METTMRYLIVGTILAATACAAPKGRPLAVPGTQAFETFEPLIDCAGLAGLMASELPGAVEELQRHGRATLPGPQGQPRCQVRILAFGEGKSGPRSGYHVVSLRHVADFVVRYLARYHRVLKPSDLPEPALGILHLLRKVR